MHRKLSFLHTVTIDAKLNSLLITSNYPSKKYKHKQSWRKQLCHWQKSHITGQKVLKKGCLLSYICSTKTSSSLEEKCNFLIENSLHPPHTDTPLCEHTLDTSQVFHFFSFS